MITVLGKTWGVTSPIFNKNNVEIHRLEGIKGGFSSQHRHTSKFNLFLVESGVIKINIWTDPNSEIPDVTVLHKGESTTVPPGVYHQFEVLENCVVYEVYHVELDINDIQRRDKGGLKE